MPPMPALGFPDTDTAAALGDWVSSICAMGFNEAAARFALDAFPTLEEAVAFLLETDGNVNVAAVATTACAGTAPPRPSRPPQRPRRPIARSPTRSAQSGYHRHESSPTTRDLRHAGRQWPVPKTDARIVFLVEFWV